LLHPWQSAARAQDLFRFGEQHVREDLGFTPSFADWVKAIRHEPWMGKALKLDAVLAEGGVQ
jgi:hypothetical protein